MTARFGRYDDCQPAARFPPERFVEANWRLDVNILAKAGGLLEGTRTDFQIGPEGSLRLTREGGIVRVEGFPVPLEVAWCEWLPGRVKPYWLCGSCGRQCWHLFVVGETIICRTCARLDYRCRHRWRTVPKLNRLLWLRRSIKAGKLFTPIAPRPLRNRRYWRIAREIRRLEAGLVGHLRHDVCDVLKRRRDRR